MVRRLVMIQCRFRLNPALAVELSFQNWTSPFCYEKFPRVLAGCLCILRVRNNSNLLCSGLNGNTAGAPALPVEITPPAPNWNQHQLASPLIRFRNKRWVTSTNTGFSLIHARSVCAESGIFFVAWQQGQFQIRQFPAMASLSLENKGNELTSKDETVGSIPRVFLREPEGFTSHPFTAWAKNTSVGGNWDKISTI